VQTGVTVIYTSFLINTNGTEGEATTIEGSEFTAPATEGLYGITASATGYAPWTTTVFVRAKA
jgi:hypothetical protein